MIFDAYIGEWCCVILSRRCDKKGELEISDIQINCNSKYVFIFSIKSKDHLTIKMLFILFRKVFKKNDIIPSAPSIRFYMEKDLSDNELYE
jgi:hypothetical protein